jgi:hypothetical protein
MRRIALALSLGLALGLGACSGDSTGPNGSVVGTYQLQKYNGVNLPYTFSGGSSLTSEQMTLNSDGTFTDILQYSNSSSPTVARGYFTANNGSITFDDRTFNIVYNGSVSGTVLTTFISSDVLVYQKI